MLLEKQAPIGWVRNVYHDAAPAGYRGRRFVHQGEASSLPRILKPLTRTFQVSCIEYAIEYASVVNICLVGPASPLYFIPHQHAVQQWPTPMGDPTASTSRSLY